MELLTTQRKPETNNLTTFDFISKNYSVFQTLLKLGKIPTSVALQYKIYKHFQQYQDQPKMIAYSLTADDMHVSENTVQRAVKDMEVMVKPM